VRFTRCDKGSIKMMRERLKGSRGCQATHLPGVWRSKDSDFQTRTHDLATSIIVQMVLNSLHQSLDLITS
jgi:hypothetical protein